MQELIRVTMDARVRREGGATVADLDGHRQCRKGHPLDDANTYWRSGRRVCRECGRISSREYERRRREQRRTGVRLEPLRSYMTDSEQYLAVALGRFRDSYRADPETGCWVWQRATSDTGYGAFSFLGRVVLAHRAAYYLLVGEVPEGLELDHLCRQCRCVNPAHLEPVTGRENNLRSTGVAAQNAAKTHCLRGHELSAGNLVASAVKRGHRRCLQCERAGARDRMRAKRASNAA